MIILKGLLKYLKSLLKFKYYYMIENDLYLFKKLF